MKAIQVTYTVQPAFREMNKQNIQKVMEQLKAHPIDGMQYTSFTDKNDPNTFVHISICRDSETLKKINEIPAFQEFQMALKASAPVSPPKAVNLELVAAGYEL